MGLFSSKKGDASKKAEAEAETAPAPAATEAGGLVLWGRANSVNVQKPLWLLRELGAAFEREDAGGPFGRLDSEEFKALSPHGEIPVLVDHRFGAPVVVWESAAIMRHVAEAARRAGDARAAALWPEDLAARAAIDRWGEWAQVNFYPLIRDLFINIVRRPAPERDLDLIRAVAEAAHAMAARADAAIAKTGGFLAGPDLTLADFPFAALIHRYLTLEISRPPLPALAAYYERLKTRAPYAGVVAVAYDDMRFAGADRSATPIV